MNAGISSGAIKKFRQSPGEFQMTFKTPLKDLDRFVTAILSANERITSASLFIDQIVFAPSNLNALFPGDDKPAFGKDWSTTTVNRQETHALLRAALADWMDFAFVPAPKPFVIYADHDEYITFFAHTKSNLNRVASALSESKFQ